MGRFPARRPVTRGDVRRPASRYNVTMSRFLRSAAGRRGITVLALALLILAVIVAVVVLIRYLPA